MLKIGLTGGIGSGKSTIAKIIGTLGYPVYISDLRASELINQNEEIRTRLTALFGKDIYLSSGLLDKKRLATIIFNDKEAIKQVNGIVHPVVTHDFTAWCAAQQGPLVFFESAILFEAKLEHLFDAIILISTDMETRIQRVISRDIVSRAKVIERINNQMPDEIKQSKSNFVIYNNDDDKVVKQILSIIRQLNNTHSKQV